MNPLSGPRQQQQKQQQKQKTLRMQKHENTLEFHSRLIEAAEVRFFEIAEPTLFLERSPFFSLGAEQLRGTQNKDGEQGDIEGCQHYCPFPRLLQSKAADHRRKQCCPGNEGIEQNGFVWSMCAFAHRTHSIQRRDSQGRGKIPVRTSACRCFLQLETQPCGHCCCAAK